MSAPRHWPGLERGASYVEVLVGAAIISIALVPMLDALRAGALVAGQQEQQVVNHYALTARLEELLVEPYSSLSSAAAAAGGARRANLLLGHSGHGESAARVPITVRRRQRRFRQRPLHGHRRQPDLDTRPVRRLGARRRSADDAMKRPAAVAGFTIVEIHARPGVWRTDRVCTGRHHDANLSHS